METTIEKDWWRGDKVWWTHHGCCRFQGDLWLQPATDILACMADAVIAVANTAVNGDSGTHSMSCTRAGIGYGVGPGGIGAECNTERCLGGRGTPSLFAAIGLELS